MGEGTGPMTVAVRIGDTLRDNDPRMPDRYLTVLLVDAARVVGYPKGNPSQPHVRVARDYLHPYDAATPARRTGWTVMPGRIPL